MPTSTKATPRVAPRTQTRRSSVDVDLAIFEAVLEELGEVGYQRLTFVGVARRAGASRRALYFRWPNKDEMINDAVRLSLPTATSFTVSGSLRKDLIDYLPRLAGFRGTLGQACRALIAESYRDPETLTPLRELLTSANRAGLRQILLEAIVRGEADPAALDPEILDVISATMFYQLCLSSKPISRSAVTRLVDRVILPLVQNS